MANSPAISRWRAISSWHSDEPMKPSETTASRRRHGGRRTPSPRGSRDSWRIAQGVQTRPSEWPKPPSRNVATSSQLTRLPGHTSAPAASGTRATPWRSATHGHPRSRHPPSLRSDGLHRRTNHESGTAMTVHNIGFPPTRHRKPGVFLRFTLLLSAAVRLSAHPASDTSVVIALRDRQTLEIAVASDAAALLAKLEAQAGIPLSATAPRTREELTARLGLSPPRCPIMPPRVQRCAPDDATGQGVR